MFDLSLPTPLTTGVRGVPPGFPAGDTNPNHPFALTLSRRAPENPSVGPAVRTGWPPR